MVSDARIKVVAVGPEGRLILLSLEKSLGISYSL
jgi:hypothetical protein